jgi:2-polyprenyl-6-methoxyphenol hydroxylase-like FAD-dependent oxidoreductase
MTRDADQVLVVGAGPTGLLLAGQLARHGVRVRMVDKRANGSGESRALGIHARTLEMLDGMGLAEEFVAHGQRVRAFSMWDGRRRLARIDFGALDSAFPFLLDIPQSQTEAILRRHLARLGVGVERSTELVGLVPGRDEVEVAIRRPDGSVERSRVPYVVGCDGAHSSVRRHLGIPFDGHGYGEDWLLADLALDWDRSHDDLHIVFNPAGWATVLMPMRDGRWRVILYFAGDRRGAGAPPTLGEVAGLVAERVPGPIAVSDPTWLASFRTHRRSAPAYRSGRVFLAGDAVHIHSPAGGQGMNTGLLDAQDLAWKLAAVIGAGASERLLDTYQAERGPVASQVLDLSHRLVRLSSLSVPWQRAARAIAVPVVTRLPGFRARAARRISQLYVHYRSSSLTEPPPRRAGRLRPRRPQPGDRAPDAAGLTCRGEPVRLHQLLRGPQHTLLFLTSAAEQTVRRLGPYRPHVRPLIVVRDGDGAPKVDGIEVANDLTGEAHRAYRGTGPHLIRPDGYLAASGVDGIEAYLRRVFG